MKLRNLLCALLAVGLGIGCLTDSDKKEKLEARAKISRSEAEKTALAKVPGGKIAEADLEEEGGKLIWTFDISTPGSRDITEVHVDALTGEVIATEKETPADQEKEKAKDRKKN